MGGRGGTQEAVGTGGQAPTGRLRMGVALHGAEGKKLSSHNAHCFGSLNTSSSLLDLGRQRSIKTCHHHSRPLPCTPPPPHPGLPPPATSPRPPTASSPPPPAWRSPGGRYQSHGVADDGKRFAALDVVDRSAALGKKSLGWEREGSFGVGA